MKKITLLASLFTLAITTTSLSQTGLQHLTSFNTNVEGSVETVAYDAINKQAFFCEFICKFVYHCRH
ncbi:hypothetical protein GSB9_01878 [Flavobacteriaceae bacterium GSB9]|nr:hypothetical protein GSB9_01878 [Flavobacteriaceae bacterium GSB9]